MTLAIGMEKLLLNHHNGVLPVDLGWAGGFRKLWVVGGPYDFFPGRDLAFGVCVRAERVPQGGYDVWLPIEDFKTPSDPALVKQALRETLLAALDDKPIFVGCMGGWGRTGLFLALFAKACGVKDPVAYVRKHYSPNAVETKAQKAYVEAFDVREITAWLQRAAWRKTIIDTLFWWR